MKVRLGFSLRSWGMGIYFDKGDKTMASPLLQETALVLHLGPFGLEMTW